jgi:hypothetical protein
LFQAALKQLNQHRAENSRRDQPSCPLRPTHC